MRRFRDEAGQIDWITALVLLVALIIILALVVPGFDL
jgi:hypothetical protein